LKQVFPGYGIGNSGETLEAILQALKKTYCNTVGVEYKHITDEQEREWIRQHLENVHSHPTFSPQQKWRIYEKLTAGEGLESYLASKFVGQKRFSLEGAIAFIPMMDELVQRAGTVGVKELIAGMAHRGRLNVLTNVLGKSPELLFREFEGKPRTKAHSGDVKYHLGFSSDVETPGNILHLALAFNPSHLEIVDPVVVGSVKARQDRRDDEAKEEVVPFLVHGDAALPGQGVVAEVLNFSQARGFKVGGTVHVVINNQLGFTTSNPLDARSSLYCTDVMKMVQAGYFMLTGMILRPVYL
jgi:2-oxoglutarate dehydrogenase E1 component